LQEGIDMITLKSACNEIYKIYKQNGYSGIGFLGDTEEAWFFLPAPAKGENELPIGECPIIYNKKTGNTRFAHFGNVVDMNLVDSAKMTNIPKDFMPKK